MKNVTKKTAALLALIMMITAVISLVSCGNGSDGGENNGVSNDSSSKWKASEGLAYEVIEENGEKTCIITGIGTCRDTEIVIPQTINGLRVSAVAEGAFKVDRVSYAPAADGEGTEPAQSEEQTAEEEVDAQ